MMLKEFQFSYLGKAIFDMQMGWFKLFLSLHVAGSLPSSFCLREYMVWKMLVDEFQDGCLRHGHL